MSRPDGLIKGAPPFVAFDGANGSFSAIIAVDIGYSATAPSCGIYSTGAEAPRCMMFGEAVDEVVGLLRQKENHLLVIEAPLSTYHDEQGNPGIRGQFESGRGWYYGAGAVTLIAAQRFLRMVARQLSRRLLLAEAFLSNKKGEAIGSAVGHDADAREIVGQFHEAPRHHPQRGSEPASALTDGIPQVLVIQPPP